MWTGLWAAQCRNTTGDADLLICFRGLVDLKEIVFARILVTHQFLGLGRIKFLEDQVFPVEGENVAQAWQHFFLF